MSPRTAGPAGYVYCVHLDRPPGASNVQAELLIASRTDVTFATLGRLVLFAEVAVETIISDRTDPHGRSLAHAALISDEWRRSGQGARDGAHEVEEAIVWPA